ncbi:hypothetical protein DM02DRAFT_611599 [Periconia macrospinosa]|uniref:AAA+ ATPase domain-containing protein n=1 Tax=Periconia macrospinosa TaxID=97972 RepID=A0A2V1E1A6_9PLEO|nr:hypothetical protein DM02DRAFT_611599 [Periconia macrospinosa]
MLYSTTSTFGGVPLPSTTDDGEDTPFQVDSLSKKHLTPFFLGAIDTFTRGNVPTNASELPATDLTMAATPGKEIEDWARCQYQNGYCDNQGKQTKALHLESFAKDLKSKRPGDAAQINEAVNRLDSEITEGICKHFAIDKHGKFLDYAAVIHRLHKMRLDLAEKLTIGQTIAEIEKKNIDAVKSASNTKSGSPSDRRASSSASPTKRQSKKKGMTTSEVEEFVRKEFVRSYCDSSRRQVKRVPDVETFTQALRKALNGYDEDIAQAVKTLDEELANKTLPPHVAVMILSLAQVECAKHAWTNSSRDLDRANIVQFVSKKHPDIHLRVIEKQVRKAEELQKNLNQQPPPTANQAKPISAPTMPKVNPVQKGSNLHRWIHQQFLDHGFTTTGFKGYKWLTNHLQQQNPGYDKNTITQAVNVLRASGSKYDYSIGNVDQIFVKRRALGILKKDSGNTSNENYPPHETKSTMPHSSSAATRILNAPNTDLTSFVVDSHTPNSNLDTEASKTDLLARKLNQLHVNRGQDSNFGVGRSTGNERLKDGNTVASMSPQPTPNQLGNGKMAAHRHNSAEGGLSDMMALLSDSSDSEEEAALDTNVCGKEIEHAPLLDEDFISEEYKELIPQYGLIGSHDEFTEKSKLFLNSNIPFSAFICGVQGSGKSHTTSCIMENVLIQSNILGKLQSPLSALVFSYGHFSGDGAGFNISEAAFLAAAHPKIAAGAHVRKVNVLVSPSNYVRMAKLYTRIPNVTVTPFRLNPRNLDIDIMLTLMNVNETGEPPLYMAQVTQILREMAATGAPFNYTNFKATLKRQNFNPVQKNMLQMRLNLLESFLDLKNNCPAPQFKPGEITIMDMSCPFVDPNTACILFRIGLQAYLQSDSPGKAIVLDEAHKYMLKVPGAKALNEALLQTVRLQRHYGARVIISTQEPTLLTDLIALCSITIIHRFSSPEWLAAIRRHIPMTSEAARSLMDKVERLKTGSALVYSPGAVLGWEDDEKTLFKGAGKMMEVKIRKRITSDGGQSVLAV